MKISAGSWGDVPLLVVQGEVDHSNSQDLVDAAEAVLGENGKTLVLDLHSVPYMDSAGVSVMLGLLRRARGGGWVGVLRPTEGVLRLLEIVGITIDRSFRLIEETDDPNQHSTRGEASLSV